MIELREFSHADARRLPEYLNNPRVTRFLSSRIPQPYTATDATWWIDVGSRSGVVRAIDLEGVLVGTIGAEPGQFECVRSAEIGYWLAEPYWGKGIASLAPAQLTRLVFDTTDIVRLTARVFEGNDASARVLEKNGYAKEGVMRKAAYKDGHYFNVALYALVQ